MARRGSPPPADQDPPGAAGLVPDPRLWQRTGIGRRKPVTGGGPGEQHFLVPPFGDWFQLERSGQPLVIGRDAQCDIRINSQTVSRRHAEVVFRGTPPRAHLRDVGTVNGTRVNGQLLTAERALADKDVVRIGDVTAIYRVLSPSGRELASREPKPAVQDLDKTMPVGIDARKAVQSLAGEVALFPMAELMGRLMVLKVSGTLVIEVDGVTGRAVFADGVIREADLGGCEGRSAILAISDLKRGRLRFEPAPGSGSGR